MRTAALIVAAGRGSRARGADATPKQYVPVRGRPVLAHTLSRFCSALGVDAVQVVIHPDDLALYNAAIGGEFGGLLPVVYGGATRQETVRLGLEALASVAPDAVLIHDGARPFTSQATITAVIAALADRPAAIAATALADTLKRADATGLVAGTVSRDGLWRAETPQGFHFTAILALHRQAVAAGHTDFTDDAGIAEWGGLSVALVPSSGPNSKITTAEDIGMAERMLAASAGQNWETRVGQGFDVHRFTAGDHVWLGGIKIPHSHSLEGHSDADVALHALTDALLGAIGDGDIGQHFPPSDAKWKGAASHLFLADAADRVRRRGGRIGNVDVTLLCEAPKIAPHREAMRARIAVILAISLDRVGVKATTTEQLGFTGRREGIAAMAAATVLLPAEGA